MKLIASVLMGIALAGCAEKKEVNKSSKVEAVSVTQARFESRKRVGKVATAKAAKPEAEASQSNRLAETITTMNLPTTEEKTVGRNFDEQALVLLRDMIRAKMGKNETGAWSGCPKLLELVKSESQAGELAAELKNRGMISREDVSEESRKEDFEKVTSTAGGVIYNMVGMLMFKTCQDLVLKQTQIA
jgi:outer membrane murein-binding lipoprotein Lpp